MVLFSSFHDELRVSRKQTILQLFEDGSISGRKVTVLDSIFLRTLPRLGWGLVEQRDKAWHEEKTDVSA